MNYIDNHESIYISLCFFIFGVFCIAVYTVLSVFLRTLRSLIFLPSFIRGYGANKNLRFLKEDVRKRLSNAGNGALRGEVFNFLFIICIGIATTLLNYILLDGEFRIYSIAAFLTGVLFSSKVLSKHLNGFICNIFSFLYTVIFVIFIFFFTVTNRALRSKKNNNCDC